MSEATTVDVDAIFDSVMDAPDSPEPTEPEAVDEPDAVETPEPDTDDVPETPETEGIPRDEHGRFAPRTQQEADAVAAAIPTPEPQPFAYRSMGETRAWDGALVQPDGSVLIAADKVGDLRAALNAKHLAEGEYVPLIERYKQEVQHYRQQAEAKTLTEHKYEAVMQGLQGALLEGDEATALEAFFQLRAELPSRMKDAEIEHYRSLALQGRTPETAAIPEQQPQQPESYPMPHPTEALAVTVDKMEHLKLDPAFKDLTSADWKQLEASHQRTPLAFIRPATPEEATVYGVRVGQPVFDEAAYHQHVTEFAELKRSGARIAKSATEAAKFNAKANQSTAPAARAPRAMAQTPEPESPPKGRQALDALFSPKFLSDDSD